MMGASAQECSAFRPIFPFLKMMKVNDLSNHLREKMEPWCLRRQKKEHALSGRAHGPGAHPANGLRTLKSLCGQITKAPAGPPSPSFLPCSGEASICVPDTTRGTGHVTRNTRMPGATAARREEAPPHVPAQPHHGDPGPAVTGRQDLTLRQGNGSSRRPNGLTTAMGPHPGEAAATTLSRSGDRGTTPL